MQFESGKTTIKLSFSFAAVVTLMLLLCEQEIVLISLFSSFFHEGGHLLFMYIFSCRPRYIIFGAFGIRIERSPDEVTDYKREALICLGGVIGNTVLIIFALCIYCFTESTFSLKLLTVNAFIAFFNLIPIRQLDAGRCTESLLSIRLSQERTNRVLEIISYVFCAALSVLCVFCNVFFGFNISLIAVTIYLICISKF